MSSSSDETIERVHVYLKVPVNSIETDMQMHKLDGLRATDKDAAVQFVFKHFYPLYSNIIDSLYEHLPTVIHEVSQHQLNIRNPEVVLELSFDNESFSEEGAGVVKIYDAYGEINDASE